MPYLAACLSLPQPVSACLGLPQPVSACLSLSQPVSACLSLLQPVSACLSLPQPVSACLSLSQPASACLSLSQPVSACLRLTFRHGPGLRSVAAHTRAHWGARCVLHRGTGLGLAIATRHRRLHLLLSGQAPSSQLSSSLHYRRLLLQCAEDPKTSILWIPVFRSCLCRCSRSPSPRNGSCLLRILLWLRFE
jgi:hypothetical protein